MEYSTENSLRCLIMQMVATQNCGLYLKYGIKEQMDLGDSEGISITFGSGGMCRRLSELQNELKEASGHSNYASIMGGIFGKDFTIKKSLSDYMMKILKVLGDEALGKCFQDPLYPRSDKPNTYNPNPRFETYTDAKARIKELKRVIEAKIQNEHGLMKYMLIAQTK